VLTKTQQSSEKLKGIYFSKMVREFKRCKDNHFMQIECDDCCQGREGCSNKSIQKGEVKNLRRRKERWSFCR
jgi:hypothetical protein